MGLCLYLVSAILFSGALLLVSFNKKASSKCTYGKFLIINSAMGNNSHKFTSNALSQWSNERYFANNCSLSSYCALKGRRSGD